jgi:hypothetical protein
MADVRRGIGRTEVLIGVAVIAVLGLIAVPLVLSSGKNGARNEVPLFVNSIREAELAYQKPFGEYVSAAPAPRAISSLDGNAVAWTSNEGFDKIGWSPEKKLGTSEIYGSYKVSATNTGFTITGTCDLDGDGERAIWIATEKEEAKPTTAANVY